MQNVKLSEGHPAIELDKLIFSYDNAATEVLNIPQWQLQQTDKCFVFGQSGAGKSTLMNLLTGVLKPTSGQIKVFGQALNAMSSRQRDRFRAQHIGVVFQQFNLIPYLTVAENIRLASWFAGKGDSHDTLDKRLINLFDALQLPTNLLQRPSRELSVGQQQRVAIVRALINQPELLVVDEPTSALDSYARDSFMKLLMTLCSEQQSTLLFVSHDLSLQSYFDVRLNLADINQAGGAQQ
ncbi:ABC transporter ATP-binding protein [Neiella holothuriorum]|uniref:ABC transporter ATP-binding protein n=1 Tax=Neiella holothuriorum TaxID=2870530 RepID=UPI001CED2026|nr:ABC transporter ATP-binding protein [Neiella holothuriorum]